MMRRSTVMEGSMHEPCSSLPTSLGHLVSQSEVVVKGAQCDEVIVYASEQALHIVFNLTATHPLSKQAICPYTRTQLSNQS